MQTGDPYGKKSKATLWWLIGGALALVGLIAFGLGSGILGLGGQRPASALSQQGDRPDPITPQVNSPVAPTTQISGAPAAPITPQEAKRMPADILAWLQHLERTEAERKRRTDELQNRMFAMMGRGISGLSDDLNEPTKQPESIAAEVHSSFTEVETYFVSIAPPQECIQIAQNYSLFLKGVKASTTTLLRIIESAGHGETGDVARAMDECKRHPEYTDRAAKEADAGIADLVRQYDAPKWFSIETSSLDVCSSLGGLAGGLGAFGGVGP